MSEKQIAAALVIGAAAISFLIDRNVAYTLGYVWAGRWRSFGWWFMLSAFCIGASFVVEADGQYWWLTVLAWLAGSFFAATLGAKIDAMRSRN